MTDTSAAIAVYDQHSEAEGAVKKLQQSEFNMKKLSIVGKDYHTDEQVVGYYNAGDRMKYWGKLGAFWGGFWGLLFGAAFFWVPAIGPVTGWRSIGGFDRRRLGGRGGSRRPECNRRRSLQHWHTKGQHRHIRDGAEGGQVSGSCSWNCGRGGRGPRTILSELKPVHLGDHVLKPATETVTS